MKHYLLTLTLLWLACGLMAAPAHAQDGCGGKDDESELEDEDGCGCAELEEEWEETGRNSAGQKEYKKKGDGSDENAPKLKRDLQTRVNEAIEKGVAWLKKKQGPDGSWGSCTSSQSYSGEKRKRSCYFSGPTTFSLYTLSKCGVKKQDKSIQSGYRWVKKKYRKTQAWNDKTGKKRGFRSPPDQVSYEVSSLMLMLEAMSQRSSKLTGKHKKRRLHTDSPSRPPLRSKFSKDDWKWLHQGVIFLTVGNRSSKGGIQGCQNAAPGGGWRYGPRNGDQDLSATQFALLGLRAASQAGYPVKEKVWRTALNGVRQHRAGGGGYSYRKGEGWSAGMDACALGSMIICKEQLELLGAPVPAWVDGHIKAAMKHLDEVFDVQHNKGAHHGSAYHYYYLYAVERVGDLTGRKEFAGKDWYVRGAEFLLAQQHGDGSWTDATCMPPRDTLGTCFALLFLKKATMPAVTLSE
ncbi:MAG: prenyltransferase/squalene oxidase repeat-containing protein [Planctomycetota bacterium]